MRQSIFWTIFLGLLSVTLAGLWIRMHPEVEISCLASEIEFRTVNSTSHPITNSFFLKEMLCSGPTILQVPGNTILHLPGALAVTAANTKLSITDASGGATTLRILGEKKSPFTLSPIVAAPSSTFTIGGTAESTGGRSFYIRLFGPAEDVAVTSAKELRLECVPPTQFAQASDQKKFSRASLESKGNSTPQGVILGNITNMLLVADLTESRDSRDLLDSGLRVYEVSVARTNPVSGNLESTLTESPIIRFGGLPNRPNPLFSKSDILTLRSRGGLRLQNSTLSDKGLSITLIGTVEHFRSGKRDLRPSLLEYLWGQSQLAILVAIVIGLFSGLVAIGKLAGEFTPPLQKRRAKK